tara:strand:+ start:709 stop:1203 length:495 start_codon:yes stop_codon:yes gene_type:complete
LTEEELYKKCHDLFLVSEDYRLVNKTNRSPNSKVGDIVGNVDGDYYRVKIERKSYLLHRLIFLMVNGYLPEVVDHKDKNTFNNNPENLRGTSKAGNRWNCKGNSGSLSGVKGVYKDGSKWKAIVNFKGERYYLGMHETIESAEIVVKQKYKELQGEYYNEDNFK